MLAIAVLFLMTGCSLLKNENPKDTASETTSANSESSGQDTGNGAGLTENTETQTQAVQGKAVKVNLYFASEDNSSVQKETREIQVQGGAVLRACISALLEGPRTEGLRQTIPEGTAIRGVNIKDKVAIVDFSKEFLNAEGLSEVTARASVVNTLAGIPGVDKVRIMVEGKALIGPSGEAFGDMQPAALDDIGEPVSGEMETLTVYFGNSNADKVVAEKHEAAVNQGDSLEKAIILELMKGPESKDLQAVIPEGARLLSVETKDGVCTLDFSKEFVDNSPGGTAGEAMTLNSIVNSLTELSSVKKVQFLIEGEKREVYIHVAFDEPFSRNAGIIGK